MQKIIIAIILIMMIVSNLFAHTISDVNKFINKDVLVTYKECGIIKATRGRLIIILQDKQDLTLDRIYSIVVILQKDDTLLTIRTNKINSINEYIPQK